MKIPDNVVVEYSYAALERMKKNNLTPDNLDLGQIPFHEIQRPALNITVSVGKSGQLFSPGRYVVGTNMQISTRGKAAQRAYTQAKEKWVVEIDTAKRDGVMLIHILPSGRIDFTTFRQYEGPGSEKWMNSRVAGLKRKIIGVYLGNGHETPKFRRQDIFPKRTGSYFC